MIRDKENFNFKTKNEGEPIPVDSPSHFGESFYRVIQSHNRKSGHYRLSLSTVKEIVKKHGVQINATNTLQAF
jgi:signal transduction histidine kinase